mgnify:CR=1 FL=1
MLAQESPMMAKANATIEVMEMSPKEKWLYENRMKYEHDKASWKHVGYQEVSNKELKEVLTKPNLKRQS